MTLSQVLTAGGIAVVFAITLTAFQASFTPGFAEESDLPPRVSASVDRHLTELRGGDQSDEPSDGGDSSLRHFLERPHKVVPTEALDRLKAFHPNLAQDLAARMRELNRPHMQALHARDGNSYVEAARARAMGARAGHVEGEGAGALSLPTRLEVAQAMNAFGLDLFARLCATDKGNVFISPLSIAAAMTMVAAGATTESANEKELGGALRMAAGKEGLEGVGRTMQELLGAPIEGVKLIVANSVWSSSSILPGYVARMQAVMAAQALPLPQEPSPVNAWVNEQTQGMIPNVLDSIDPLTVALIVNAVYFKGEWTKKFDATHTHDAPFHLTDGSTVPVKMMAHSFDKMAYAEVMVDEGYGITAQVGELRYGPDEKYSALILLPPPELSADKLVASLNSLQAGAAASEVWQKWTGRMSSRQVNLQLPRFKAEYGVRSLNDPLMAMGVRAAFGSKGEKELFLSMSNDPDVHLSAVLHKATVGIMMTRSMAMPLPPVEMIVNRPFIFAIRERETGLLLFIGRIDQPQ
eukprot:jgi/Mesvir1/23906/Mv10686-RA.2